MDNSEKVVNGFHFLPPSLAAWFAKDIPAQPFNGDIPWTPLKKPISETTFTLMTSAGISMKTDPPFDVAREKREPASLVITGWIMLQVRQSRFTTAIKPSGKFFIFSPFFFRCGTRLFNLIQK